jgi:hypothetical protein
MASLERLAKIPPHYLAAKNTSQTIGRMAFETTNLLPTIVNGKAK